MRAWVLLSLLLFGCAEGFSFFKGTPTFFPTAQQNYEYGVKELKAGNWQTSIQFFEHVKKNFGFSKFATMSELGIADANLGRDKYTEAIEGYKQFIKAHPTNEHVVDGYAAYKIGEAYTKQIPSDWFLSPPSYEKDQGPVLDAVRELQSFLDQYKDSPHRVQAKKLLDGAVKRIADHELYVAKFYLDRNRPYAAIGRLEHLIKEYPASQRESETLMLLGKTYLKMNKPGEARATFERLKAEYPDDFRAGKAQLYIDFIDRKNKKG